MFIGAFKSLVYSCFSWSKVVILFLKGYKMVLLKKSYEKSSQIVPRSKKLEKKRCQTIHNWLHHLKKQTLFWFTPFFPCFKMLKNCQKKFFFVFWNHIFYKRMSRWAKGTNKLQHIIEFFKKWDRPLKNLSIDGLQVTLGLTQSNPKMS